MEVVPHEPLNLRRGALTTQTQLEVEWDDYTNQAARGGLTATIISYRIEWDSGLDGDASWTVLAGIISHHTNLEYLHDVSGTVSSGIRYRFRIAARNKYGWGDYSDVVSVLAAVVPDAPTPVVT